MAVEATNKPLQELLKSYTDVDVVAFYLGYTLYLWDDTNETFLDNKYVFWTDNPLGNLLYDLMYHMEAKGLLEIETREFRLRWNQNYGSGETS